MCAVKLPTALLREPLIDALFEMRFEGAGPVADILPGFLFNELGNRPIISRLPTAEIPEPLRLRNPELEFAPLYRLELENYFVLFGSRSALISCKLPYPKWPAFKAKILEIVDLLGKPGIIGNVLRFSLKYVNILEAETLEQQAAKIKLSIRLGDIEVKDQEISLKVHHQQGEFLHIMSILSGAEATLFDGSRRRGVVVDIDSICTIKPVPFLEFFSTLEPYLEALRQQNKAKFFGCLTDRAIEELEPTYA